MGDKKNDLIDVRQCPFCGNLDMDIVHDQNQGHGDRTFSNLRVVCLNCEATQGIGNYGSPTPADRRKAVEAWNKRIYKRYDLFDKKEQP